MHSDLGEQCDQRNFNRIQEGNRVREAVGHESDAGLGLGHEETFVDGIELGELGKNGEITGAKTSIAESSLEPRNVDREREIRKATASSP